MAVTVATATAMPPDTQARTGVACFTSRQPTATASPIAVNDCNASTRTDHVLPTSDPAADPVSKIPGTNPETDKGPSANTADVAMGAAHGPTTIDPIRAPIATWAASTAIASPRIQNCDGSARLPRLCANPVTTALAPTTVKQPTSQMRMRGLSQARRPLMTDAAKSGMRRAWRPA